MHVMDLEQLARRMELLKLAIAGLDIETTVSGDEKFCLTDFCGELIDQIYGFIEKGKQEHDKSN